MSSTIAEYFATLKFRVDSGNLKSVDSFLTSLEQRLKKADAAISKLTNFGAISPKGLSANKRAIKELSDETTKANKKALTEQKELNAFERVRLATENLRQKGAKLAASASKLSDPTSSSRGGLNGGKGGINPYHAVAGAAVAGFGIEALDDTLQKLQLLPVALEAVTGSATKAAEQLDFISKLGHNIGATRLELAPEYTKMLASAMGTSMEKDMPRIFSALTVYGKVMGLDQEEMRGSSKAVTQMINKQQIMAEELKGQLAERLPAAIKIMADAVAGGDTKKLIKMMKAGEVDPKTALLKFAIKLEERAAGGVEQYKHTTRAQKNFARVAAEDQVINFGKEGGNEGFYRIWKTIADTLNKSTNTVKALAQAFSGLSRIVAVFGKVLQGLDTAFGWFYKLPDQLQAIGRIAALVFIGMTFKAKVLGGVLARAFWPLTAAYLVLQDIWGYLHGMDSVTGDVVKAFSSSQNANDKTTTGAGAYGNKDNYKPNPSGKLAAAKRARDAEKQNATPLANLPQTAQDRVDQANAQNAKAWGDNNINISVDVTGNNASNADMAKAISDHLTTVLKPVILSKVPVE